MPTVNQLVKYGRAKNKIVPNRLRCKLVRKDVAFAPVFTPQPLKNRTLLYAK